MSLKKHMWMFLLILAVVSLGCSSGDGAGEDGDEGPVDGDIDRDTSDGDGDLVDGDMTDDDAEFNCLISGCDSGYYCDDYDGQCKGCTEDLHCGNPDPLTGIVPVCRGGRCKEVVCSGIVEVEGPADGASLPTTPLSPKMQANGTLIVGNKAVFALGVQAIHPDLFDDARSAGANLVVSSSPCCEYSPQVEYQLDEFLYAARIADLYAGLQAVNPLETYADNNPADLMNSIVDRSNQIPMLFWMAGDRASRSGQTQTALTVYDDITSTIRNKPIAFGEHWQFEPAAYGDKDAFFIVSLNPDSLTPGVELLRYDDKPIWARIETAQLAETDYLVFALHALANGAGGLIFELDDETSDDLPVDWPAISSTLRWLRNRSSLWLAEKEHNFVTLTTPNAQVAMQTVFYENKVYMVYLVNAGTQAQQVTLDFAPAALPFCLGVEGEDQVLHMTRESQMIITLEPREVRVYQVSEAQSPGEDNPSR